MTVHKLYYGGDLRPVGFYNHSRKTDTTTKLVRYAGHLPTKHFVVPFEYDGGLEEWQYYAELHESFAKGDVVYTHSLSADSRVDALVIHNKKAAGTKDDKTGKITKAAKVKFGLYDGETMVAETDTIDMSVVGRTVLEFGKAVAAKADTPKDTNKDGKVDKDDMPKTAITSLGAYLGSNGSIRMTVVDDSGINGACFTAFVEVVDFLDVRGCSCVSECCPSEYPEPQCM